MAFYSSSRRRLILSFAFHPSTRSDVLAVANPSAPAVVLLTEWFPPDVGGSPVLFEAVYSRLKNTDVIVLADNKIAARPVAVQRTDRDSRSFAGRLSTTRWGISMNPKGALQPSARRAGG